MFKKLLFLFMISLMLFIIPGCDSSDDAAAGDPLASLTLDKSTVTFDSNSTAAITATAKKADGTDDTVSAESSDTDVATVSVNGLIVTVTGIKAGSSTIAITSGSGKVKTCSAVLRASWNTFFEDDFNSATLNSKWEIASGDTDNYTLDGEKIGLRTTNEGGDSWVDGVIKYEDDFLSEHYRISGKLITKTISDTVEFDIVSNAKIIFDENEDNDIGYDATIGGGEMGLNKMISGDNPIGPEKAITINENTTYNFEFIYNSGELTYKWMDVNNTIIEEVTGTETGPALTEKGIYFAAEDQGTQGNYVYLDDIKIEEYK